MGVVFSISTILQDEIDLLDLKQASLPIGGVSTRRLVLKSKLSHQLLRYQGQLPIQQIIADLSLAKKLPIFADSCRLVRRWLAFNFLSKTLEGLAVELLVAHAFTSPDLSTPL